jgi:signal transduction histidine kinase
MCAALGSSFVTLAELTHMTTFRWTLVVASAFFLCTVLLFGFVCWQTAVYLMNDNDALLSAELHVFVANTPEQRLQEIDDRLRKDPQHIKVAGLFGPDGRRIAGNIESLPTGLPLDVPTNAVVVRLDHHSRGSQKVRIATHSLPDGETMVIGRNVDEIGVIAKIVLRALALGLLPAIALAVAIGIVLSLRARNRLLEVNRKIQRIVVGDLRERLPTSGSGDPFDQLAAGVNRMLREIEALIREISSVGNDIAHDLRTPLTRVRVRLERGRARAGSLDELRKVVDQSITGLDQSLGLITALLRITEIEHTRRLDGFSEVQLAPLVREVGELYEPIAEDKRIALQVEIADEAIVKGDRDLLFEAVANVVDNAVKFTPEGGRVELALLHRGSESVIRVSDTGPGIPEIERQAVTKRFYRSDKSRATEGLGLGLSLVAAIVKLHGFRFTIAGGPASAVEIAARSALN